MIRSTSTAIWIEMTNRLRDARERGTERGLTTTEVAVLTFILVAIAVAVGGLLWNYARETVETQLPETDLTPEIP